MLTSSYLLSFVPFPILFLSILESGWMRGCNSFEIPVNCKLETWQRGVEHEVKRYGSQNLCNDNKVVDLKRSGSFGKGVWSENRGKLTFPITV